MDADLDQLVAKNTQARRMYAPVAEGVDKAQSGWSGLMHMFSGVPHATPKNTAQPDSTIPTLSPAAKRMMAAKPLSK
jgi:hypothetical protein